MIPFTYTPIAYGAELGDLYLLWHSLHVAPQRFVVRFLKRVQFRLQPGNFTPSLLVVHPELDLVYLVANVPQLLLFDVAVRIYQRLQTLFCH